MQFINSILAALSLLCINNVTANPVALDKRTSRTSAPSGCKIVHGSGTLSGEYSTLTLALASLSTTSTAAACIFIYAGTYNEGVYINYKGALTLYGETTE
jgi:pectinesterase